jgi:hypothetical protein
MDKPLIQTGISIPTRASKPLNARDRLVSTPDKPAVLAGPTTTLVRT